jgi:hypothetical protein
MIRRFMYGKTSDNRAMLLTMERITTIVIFKVRCLPTLGHLAV